MKPLTILFCFALSQSFAQSDYDSLKQKVLRMDLAINNIHFNMQKHHRQFTTGISVTVIGALVTTIGIVITSNDPDDATGTGLAGTGSAITLAGSVITIDSHKWLGRGAWRRKNLYE